MNLSFNKPNSAALSINSVVATFKTVVVSLMFESPTIMCNLRYSSGSACGSSLVLIIGRDLVVALETDSHMCSALWLIWKFAPFELEIHFPAPQNICLVIRNGIMLSVTSSKFFFLLTEKFS